jgi:uncharacterized protein YdaU (DUF1376 family)
VNFFNLYPGDYLRDTTRLTLIEHGAYLRLMLAYYGEEAPLPADPAELYNIVCAVTAADKAATRKVADRYFPVGDDGMRHNDRADEEIAKGKHRIETSRKNGAKHKAGTNPAGNPPGMPAANPMGSSRDTQQVSRSGTQQLTRSGVGVKARASLSGKELPYVAAVGGGRS